MGEIKSKFRPKGILIAVFLVGLLIFSYTLLKVEVTTINNYLRAFVLISIAFVVANLSEYLSETPQERGKHMIASNKQNEFIKSSVESLNYPFYVIDANDYTIKIANSAATDSKMLTKGITCYALTHRCKEPCKGPNHQCPLKEIKKTKKPVVTEHVHYDKDGKKQIFEINGYPILDEDGNVSQIIEYSLDITERKKASQKLLKQKEQLQFLASELTLAEERERRSIAIALHDDVLQSMILLNLNLKLGELHSHRSTENLTGFLYEATQLTTKLIEKVRSLTFDLSSPVLYELGLEAAIRRLLKTEIKEKHGIATQFEDDGLHKPLSDDLRTHMYRSVRELLINIIKHANAKQVEVSIEKDKNTLRIIVADDGVGFHVSNDSICYDENSGFGLFSIRERLDQFGGTMDINSKPGHGTRIILSAPLKEPSVKESEVLV